MRRVTLILAAITLALIPSVASADLLPFLMLTEQQAARFREATAGSENRLEPRLVEAGPYKGKYVLPRRVMFDPAFAAQADAFALLTDVQMDTSVAFPLPAEN